jgi:hypothetical protein
VKRTITITRDFEELGRLGGKARARNQTPAARKRQASKAARARWEKAKKAK